MMTLWIAGLAVAAQVSSFEVASVKPVNPPAGPHVVSLIINHGRLNIEAAELRQIVGLAYAVQRIRVLGGPGWADSDQFDIAARAESADATRDEIRSMLQTLLTERFKLVVHRETKEIPAYSLVLAKGGSKLKVAAPDRKSGMADTVGLSGERQTVFEASSLRVLANMLANTLGSPVVDKTGLDGLYDYTFEMAVCRVLLVRFGRPTRPEARGEEGASRGPRDGSCGTPFGKLVPGLPAVRHSHSPQMPPTRQKNAAKSFNV